MNKFSLLLVLFLCLLFISCGSNEPEYLSSVALSESDIAKGGTYRIASDSEINLYGLNPNNLYSVIVDSSNARSINDKPKERMYNTKVGSTLLIPNLDGSLSFLGKDLDFVGISDMEITNILCANNDFKIEESDPHLLFYQNGTLNKLYEEFYLIDVEKLKEKGLDISDVAIADIHLGSGAGSTDYGIITDIEDLFYGFSSTKAHSVLDLTGKMYIWLYNSLSISKSGNPRSKELKIVNPINLSLNTPIDIEDTSCIYRVNKDDVEANTEYVIEIIPSRNIGINNYAMLHDNANPRYEDGYRKKYLFPMSKGDTLLFYVGEVDNDFIFDFYMSQSEYESNDLGKIQLRALHEEDPDIVIAEIEEAGYNQEITISENTPEYIPIKVESSDGKYISNLKITMSCNQCDEYSRDVRLTTVSGHTDGLGQSRRSIELNDGNNIIIRSNDTIEYAYMDIKEHQSGHKIEISITPNTI